MPLIASPTLVKQRFRFIVEVGGVQGASPLRAKFRSCSELSMELGKSEIYHGGSVLPFKMPGRITASDVTLESGATQDGSLYSWFAQAAAGIGGGKAFAFKRPVSIVEQDRDFSSLNRWHLAAAFPLKFVAGEWDNGSDEFTIASVT